MGDSTATARTTQYTTAVASANRGNQSLAANHKPAPQHIREPPTLDTMTSAKRQAALEEFDCDLGKYPGAAEYLDQQRAIKRHNAACRGPYRPFLTTERISIPDDLEDRSLPKASGKVTLPRHIAWSFPTATNSTTASPCGPATSM